MKVESLQKPVANYEITFIDKEYVEVDFFTNIEKKQRKENEDSDKMIDYYEYDNYKIKVRNRFNLESQIDTHYDEWLKYAIANDDREHIPTEYEIIKMQYDEYEGMDTPSTIEEMKLQDPALATEYLNMMIELRGLMYTLSVSGTQSVGYATIHIPAPSQALKEFKNRFKRV